MRRYMMYDNNTPYTQTQPVPGKKRIPARVLGIVSFACGITGLATFVFVFLGLCFSITAIITGAISRSFADGEEKARKGMIMGIIGASLSTLTIIAFFALLAANIIVR